MNWGVRVAVIAVILGGLVWLNWSRFTEENLELLVDGEKIIQEDASQVISNALSDKNGNPAQEITAKAGVDSNSSAPKVPEFVLQAAPESLNDSDTQVQELVKEISSEASVWLQAEEQLRKWVLLITQAAEGKIILQDRPFNISFTDFIVEEREQRFFMSSQNFQRYDSVVDILSKLPADKLVAYYRAWYPILEQAFGELGLPGSFDERVDSMIQRVLSAELMDMQFELKKPTSVTYKFMDPKFESASQIEKCLWRMGPKNARKIQDLAQRLKQALEK